MMFLTSFNVYFVFGYTCFLSIWLKTAIWLFLGKVWLFWWRQVGNPVSCYKRISQSVLLHFRQEDISQNLAETSLSPWLWESDCYTKNGCWGRTDF